MHFGVVLIESVSPVNELLMDNLSDPVCFGATEE
jgi:hypothetical protein